MSTKALSEEEKKAAKERTRWVIGYICDKFKMTNEKIGKEMGCATSTINSYRRMITLPGRDFAVYLKKYNISTDWFDEGKGEPFPGAREKYSHICGQKTQNEIQYDQITESVHHHIKEAQMQYNPNPDALFKSDQKINIEEAMGKAYKVLTAGTALSVALFMNIQQFAIAQETGKELQECKELVKGMQSQIDELNTKVDRLSSHPTSTEGQGDASESVKVA
jgi:hypothetical protein